MSFLTVLFESSFNKKAFSCGIEALDNYLHKQANQDVKRKLAACYVFPDANNNVIGYYTISSDSILQEILPLEVTRKLPNSYLNLPVILIGRLARDIHYKGQGIGEHLLLDALHRCYYLSFQVGSMAVVVDPIDRNAVNFYQKYDFQLLPDSGRMFLEMETIKGLFP